MMKHVLSIERCQRPVSHIAKHKMVPNCQMTEVVERAKCVTPHITSRPPSVVIVGGGLAALSAAERLENAGIHDVKILEAQKELVMGGER